MVADLTAALEELKEPRSKDRGAEAELISVGPR
jgi:hypothetical protein